MIKPFNFRKTLIVTAISSIPIQLWRSPDKKPSNHQEEIKPMTELAQAVQEPETMNWLESMDWETPIPATVIFSIDPKEEQATLVKTIGSRMKQARELCNLSQTAAARRLGYSNSSKLAKVEGATDTNSVPLWLIVRAARIYEVSIDYLFGVSDDWEIGVPRGTQPWLLEAWQRLRERDLAALMHLHKEISVVSQQITALAAGVQEVVQALDIMRIRNPGFDDLLAGGTLTGRLERLQERARTAEQSLKRFRMGPQFAIGNGEQA